MPPKRGAEGTPEEWLRRAKGNLALAKQRKPKDAYWETYVSKLSRRWKKRSRRS